MAMAADLEGIQQVPANPVRKGLAVMVEARGILKGNGRIAPLRQQPPLGELQEYRGRGEVEEEVQQDHHTQNRRAEEKSDLAQGPPQLRTV